MTGIYQNVNIYVYLSSITMYLERDIDLFEIPSMYKERREDCYIPPFGFSIFTIS